MLWSALRQAGVSHLAQVALVVLEPNGQISVVRAGQPIHPRALLGVKGAHRVQEHLRGAGHRARTPRRVIPGRRPPVARGCVLRGRWSSHASQYSERPISVSAAQPQRRALTGIRRST